MKQETLASWFWVATTINVVATISLVLLLYSALVMLALFTSPVTMVPFYLLPAIVLFLSIMGLLLTRRYRRCIGKWAGYAVHSCGFLLSFLVLAYLAFLQSGVGSGKETYLIPDGYEGQVSVIYQPATGDTHSKAPSTAVYRIPPDGVLVVLSPRVSGWSGWTVTRYYYVARDGARREIMERWLSTIDETPENLSNTRDIGIFFPTAGSFGDSNGCQFQIDQFYVGTKAYLLHRYKPIDLNSYMRGHNLGCISRH